MARSRSGDIFGAHRARPHAASQLDVDLQPTVALLRRARSSACSTRSAGRSTASRATPTVKIYGAAASSADDSRDRPRRARQRRCTRRSARAIVVDHGRPHDRRAHAPRCSRRSRTGELAERYGDRPDRRPQRLPAHALQEARASPRRYRDRRRPGRPRDAGGPLQHPEQGRSTRPGTCPTATGPASSPARSSPAATPRTRSRRAGWASTTAPASTAPTPTGSIGTTASHGCIRMRDPGRRSSSTTRSRSGRPVYIA